jgi:hypothetical protein
MITTTAGKESRYVLKEDRDKPEAEQTTFVLQTMKAKAKMKVTDAIVGFEDGEAAIGDAGTALYEACKYGIKTWENLRDENGEEVPCRFRLIGGGSILLEPSLDAIGTAIIELGSEILRINRLTGGTDDQGNATGEAGNC